MDMKEHMTHQLPGMTRANHDGVLHKKRVGELGGWEETINQCVGQLVGRRFWIAEFPEVRVLPH